MDIFVFELQPILLKPLSKYIKIATATYSGRCLEFLILVQYLISEAQTVSFLFYSFSNRLFINSLNQRC